MTVQVTSRSSDQEILDAIDAAGGNRHPWRMHDWPEEGKNKSWVIATDIGVSNRGDRSLLKRLKSMVKMGLLEVRGIARFRVIHR